MEAKLTVRSLRKTYGGVVALNAASFEVREGEFLTLLGPSGSGKTTILMILAGLIQPDSGEVWIDGHLSTYAPSHRRDVGVVFQSYALFPHLTVFENVAFPLRMRKLEEREIVRRVDRILEAVQLPHVAGRLPRELSGGQQQRIALARATVYEPSIILMDEPLGALDKKLRDRMQLEIKRLHTKLGITVLYVTHDQEEAMVMSDRICLMNGGNIEQIGTPKDLYFRPATVFAADFLGESNIFAGHLKTTDADGATIMGPGGSVIRAPSAPAAAAGQAVNCMVRPEAIRILQHGESADNRVEALVEEVILTGAVSKCYARLPDGTEIKAIQLSAGPSDIGRTGHHVQLGWATESTVVLP